MDDDLDDGPVAFNPNATTASLGFLGSDPKSAANDGDWSLLLEDDQQQPLQLAHIALSFDYPQAPIELAAEALTGAGYEHRRVQWPAKPWAAQWQLITEADRLPRTVTP